MPSYGRRGVPQGWWNTMWTALLSRRCVGLLALLLILRAVFHESRTCTPTSPANGLNIGGQPLHQTMCWPPIDVVVTWVNGTDARFQKVFASYQRKAKEDNKDDDEDEFATKRFRDNDELRYTLRSLELHAPWIRHVFLVTNGQIPNWLNLSHPALTVVTHREIFEDPGAIPTFSSPAIEANLHRIPGLSDFFLYFNDDTMLGMDILPGDFLTPSLGQKVYLTWPVPHCAPGCLDRYIGDGTCDDVCNREECNWDDGDCLASPSSPVCRDVDLGNGRCDRPCDLPGLAFDAADCYSSNLDASDDLVGLRVVDVNEVLDIPSGANSLFVDMESFRGGKITEADVNGLGIVRKARVLQYDGEVQQLVLVLHPDKQGTIVADLRGFSANKDPLHVSIRLHVHNTSSETSPPDTGTQHVERGPAARRLLDTYTDSVRFVNRMLDEEFGKTFRRIPAHMPHLLNRHTLNRLRTSSRFSEAWKRTASNRFRRKDDVQFAFTYFHFLMNEPAVFDVRDVFRRIDTNGDGTFNDNELHTLECILHGSPSALSPLPGLSSATFTAFKKELLACGGEMTGDQMKRSISCKALEHCTWLVEELRKVEGSPNRNEFELVPTDSIGFEMIGKNTSMVRRQCDALRARTKKFICLNDDMGDTRNEEVLEIVRLFYTSLFPRPSSFELRASAPSVSWWTWSVAVCFLLLIVCSIFVVRLSTSRYPSLAHRIPWFQQAKFEL